MTEPQSEAVWRPFLDWIAASPQDFALDEAQIIGSIPARNWWDANFLRGHLPGAVMTDPRSRTAQGDVWWVNDAGQVGWFLHGYQSVWLPASLLDKDQAERLTDRLFAASRQWSVLLAFNKWLAGAPHDAVAAARNTATNPAVLTAFALAIIVGAGPPAYPGIPGHEPDLGKARQDAGALDRAMDVAQARAGCRLICVGEQLFRARLAALFLGRQLPVVAGG